MSKLGSNVKFLRKQHGMTLEQLALKSGLDTSNLSRLERGIGGFSKEGIQRLCEALGVSEGTLFADGLLEDVAQARTRRIPVLTPEQASHWDKDTSPALDQKADSHILVDIKASKYSFALVVADDSMWQMFTEGDMVIVEADIEPHPGDFVIATVNFEPVVLRQFRIKGIDESGKQVIELLPLNTFYPPVSSDTNVIHIIGTMVEHRKYRSRGRFISLYSA